ncbi:MAG: class I SAM-dependent methyltransferase [Terriglobales bacterium]
MMYDAARFWDALHETPRFVPVYPSEHVVRFLARYRAAWEQQPRELCGLDIGAGGGRHTALLGDFGLRIFGLDISASALGHARERLRRENKQAGLVRASMASLPFRDEVFDVAISYGVYNYGPVANMQQAIAELHRVLRRGAVCFAMLRTTADYRFGKGEEIEPRTFRLTISDTNEEGTVQHFLCQEDVTGYFARFSRVSFEKTETTYAERQRLDSDWLITAQK